MNCVNVDCVGYYHGEFINDTDLANNFMVGYVHAVKS